MHVDGFMHLAPRYSICKKPNIFYYFCMIIHYFFVSMQKLLFFVCLWLIGFGVMSQSISVSDSAKISLLTCSPGPEVYAQYGHSALRINDPASGLDIVFNYGTFDSSTNNFLGKFISGATDYQLSVYETARFLPGFEQSNSMVTEQVLNLNLVEKRKLINSLLENYQPENRLYRYNFIYDNCSTRPRDLILRALHGRVEYNESYDRKSFRDWVGDYVGYDSWTKFGIDLIFGVHADSIASQKEAQFLPEVLMQDLENAQILQNNGQQKRNLVLQHNVLVHKKVVETNQKSERISPIIFSYLLLVLGVLIIFLENQLKLLRRVYDTLLMLVSGIVGFIIVYMMFFSVHPLMQENYNLLWLNPLNIFAAVALWFNSMRKYLYVYHIINTGLVIIALIICAMGVQVFNNAFFPLMILFAMRYGKRIFRANKKKHSKKFVRVK